MDYYHGWSETAEDDGRCRRHPSPPLHGVCPACLRERLSLLCPDCASPRLSCSCHPSSSTSTSTSTSSSGAAAAAAAASSSSDHAAVGTVAPMSYFIGAEPSLRRSRSAAVAFLRTRPSDDRRPAPAPAPAPPGGKRRRLSISKLLHFWVFRRDKSKGGGEPERVEAKGNVERLFRSRSVGASCRPPEPPSAAAGGGGKGRGWYFPSPIKAFRQSKADKILQQRSPLCRG